MTGKLTLLPAEFTGDFELLLERLEQGIAEEPDQQWAARILRAARIPSKIAGGHARAEDRELRIYLEVRSELQSGCSKDEAFKRVATLHTTARGYDDSERDDGKRPLTPKRVGEIYRAKAKSLEHLGIWLDQHRDEIFPDVDEGENP